MRPERQLLLNLMEIEGVRKSQLARRVGKDRRTVAELFRTNADRSMRVSDLVEYADALGYELQLTAVKKPTERTAGKEASQEHGGLEATNELLRKFLGKYRKACGRGCICCEFCDDDSEECLLDAQLDELRL